MGDNSPKNKKKLKKQRKGNGNNSGGNQGKRSVGNGGNHHPSQNGKITCHACKKHMKPKHGKCTRCGAKM